jgi:hypothetical protein
MDMVTGGAITAVVATTTVGIGATTMAGGIIAIGGDSHLKDADCREIGCRVSWLTIPASTLMQLGVPPRQ